MSDFSNSPIVYISNSLLEIINNANINTLLEAIHQSHLAEKLYILLLIYMGLRLILGYGDIKELMSTLFKIVFIATVLYSAEYGFREFVTPGVKGIRTFLEHSMQYSGVPNNSESSLYQRLDNLGTKGFMIARSAMLQFQWDALATYLYILWAIFIIIATIILIALMSFTLLGAEVITLLMLTIGPIFIVLFLFTSTRTYFFLWISAVVSNIILFAICSFFIALSTHVIGKIEEENKIIQSLTAQKSIDEINESIYTSDNPGLLDTGTSYRKEVYKFIKEKEKEVDKLKIERDSKIKAIELEIKNRTGCGGFFNSCDNQPEISKISKEYAEKIHHTEEKYKKIINELDNTRDERIANLKKIIDDYPVTQEIYLGIILLLVISIKITSEIPGIAQTLSGGMGAGAAAAALAHQGIGMAKSAAIGAITGVAGASYAALKWAKNKTSPAPSPMQQMLEKVDTLSTQVQQQTALLERFDPRPAQPYPALTPAPQHDEAPSPKPNPAEETKPGKIKDETHIAAPQNPQNAPEPAATPPQPSQLAEGKGKETTGVETAETGNNGSKTSTVEKPNVEVDVNVTGKGRNSSGDGGSPNNGLPSNAAHGASGIGGAIDSAQRESAQQQSQTGSNTQPSTPATSGGSGSNSKGISSASNNSNTPPAPQNEKKPSITDPKGNKPPKEPPIKKL